MNVRILWDIFTVIRNKKSKLILYTYDSFLFDLSKDEEYLKETIKGIFDKYQFNIKTKQGYNYDFK